MAINFTLSKTAAGNFLNQAEKQLETATRLDGQLAASVATVQVNRAENLYGQVNTFLGLARTSNSKAFTEINDMGRYAVGPEQNQETRNYSTIYQNIQRGIDAVQTSSNSLINGLNTIRYNEKYNKVEPAAVSAGTEVIGERQAQTEDALVTNPPPPLQTFDDEGNLTDIDTNVSGESNATEPQLLNTADLGLIDGATQEGGSRDIVTVNQTQDGKESAPNDDSRDFDTAESTPITESNTQFIAPEFLQPIVAKTNPLSRLASMTYTISIYLMNLEEYKKLLLEQRKVLPTQQLLIQSGGIDQGLGAGVGQRNKYFDVDFYIDDLQIQSEVGTQSGSRAHNGLLMDFNIIEPNGISLLQRLRAAVRENTPNASPTQTELNANFLMVIRFYGYDAQGNLVNGSQLGIKEAGSDNTAVVEKWFPFQLNNITYRIANKLVEYKCTATIPQVNVAFSQGRGTIPFDFQLMAPDVKTLLNGKAVLGATTQATATTGSTGPGSSLEAETGVATGATGGAPPKASTLSSTKTYTQGLCEALNDWQKSLVASGDQAYADEYVIELENIPGLADAKMARQGVQDKSRTAQTPANTAKEQLNPKTNKYDKDSKNWSVTRGTQVAQLIDLVMRNSTYITRQQNLIYDEVKKTYTPQTPGATFQWYRIRSQITPLKYDPKRRDYSYRIVYIVSRYQVNDPRIPVFPRARYRGAHKIYNYWFTGQNSEVLDLDFSVEYNYVTPFASNMNKNSDLTASDRLQASSGRLFEKRYFQNKPNSEGTGGTSDTTTAAAAVAERYYTDGDIQKANLTIIGDPDWLQQSEVLYNATVDLSPFMPDGSVNYDASEVLYEIRFNPVTDYNASDGLAHVNANNMAYSQATGEYNLPSESSVFAAARVNSLFKGGKFTQKLIGTIRQFDPALADATAQTLSQRSGSAVLENDSDRTNTVDSTNSRALAGGTDTFTLENPTYSDPYGTGDPAAVLNAVSNPAPKAGSTVVSDDAIPEYGYDALGNVTGISP